MVCRPLHHRFRPGQLTGSDLALQEYSTLVHSLDPTAVPPETPKHPTNGFLDSTPELSTTTTSPSLPSPSETPGSLSTSESISNLIIGQKGVQRLFTDFTSTLTSREKSIHALEAKMEELQHTLETVREQLLAETALRVASQAEREKALRDDASAAKVVERYMTFTQKTHATVHMHLENLRARSQATQASLRQEAGSLRKALNEEKQRNLRLRAAVDEMSEGLSRESAGRRREVGLRLKMVAQDEVKARKVERWLERVNRLRDGAEGAVLEPDILEGLLDEGLEAVGSSRPVDEAKRRSWRGLLGRKKSETTTATNDGEEESIARILLAEELVTTLVQDLQVETDKRMELERQRVDWLAREAAEGVKPEEGDEDGHMVFDIEHEDHSPQRRSSTPGEVISNGELATAATSDPNEAAQAAEHGSLTPPLSVGEEPSPGLQELRSIFEPLHGRAKPLQTNLHSLSLALSSLRASLPSPVPKSPMLPSPRSTAGPKKGFLPLPLPSPLSRRPPPAEDPALHGILDGIYEVIEDARVDVEIAVADEDRVFSGFEALLGVGSVVQSSAVLKDAREYLADRVKWEGFEKLLKRADDIEHDLNAIKRALHQAEGMEIAPLEDHDEHGTEEGHRQRRSKSVWDALDLRTVSPSPSVPGSPFPGTPTSPLNPGALEERLRRPSGLLNGVGNVGRSFSASVIGAPRKVGGLASGLYTFGHRNRAASGNSPGNSPRLPSGFEEEEDLMSPSLRTREEDEVE